ncbi:MAG: hypothetical protein JXA30_10320 [Deltaproteobacteria bacterium]|nr:hypothetical protein [Deltaproteobacteria bacterium]
MVFAVPDGCQWKRTKRSGRESAKLYVSSRSTQGPKDPSTPARGQKPVLRDELGAVVTIHRYPLSGYQKLAAGITGTPLR